MSLKHLTIGAVVAVGTFVAPAVAQKNELSGILGRTFISDQGIQGAPSYDPNLRFGKGLTFEVNYARGLMGGYVVSLALEVPFFVNLDEDLHAAQNVIPEQYSSYFVTPAARVNLFPQTAVSPWASFGGGFGDFRESSTLEFGGVNPGKTGTTTGVLQAGVGLDVKILATSACAVRLETSGRVCRNSMRVPERAVNTTFSSVAALSGTSEQKRIPGFPGHGIFCPKCLARRNMRRLKGRQLCAL
jgi:hypothetical protein